MKETLSSLVEFQNIFESRELNEKGTISKMETVHQQQDQEYASDFDREIKRLEGGKEE